VAEWLKAHAWKACKRETVSRVRIPLSPPFFKDLAQLVIYNKIVWSSYGRQQMKNIFATSLILLFSSMNLLLSNNAIADVLSYHEQKKLVSKGIIKKGITQEYLELTISPSVWSAGTVSIFDLRKSGINVWCSYEGLGYCFDGKPNKKNSTVIQIWEDPIDMADHWLKKASHKKNIKQINTFKIDWHKYYKHRPVNKKTLSSGSEVAKKKPSESSSSGSKKRTSAGASGSAFFVTGKGHIITNYHVIQNCRSTPKIKYKDKDVEAKVIAKDNALDLALLKADLRNTKYLSLSNDQPKKLQRIIASGYPFGKYISDDLKFTSGIVSSLKGPGDDSTIVQVDAALNPGNSGGPIVDEKTGELVAVSVMGMKKSISEGQNFGIKTSSVKNFLAANQVKIPSSWFNTSDVAKLLEDTTLYTYCN
jgi:S1-C subfamily serine protease